MRSSALLKVNKFTVNKALKRIAFKPGKNYRVFERLHPCQRFHSSQGIHTNKRSFKRWKCLKGDAYS